VTERAQDDLRVAVLGLGEAGASIAADLVALGVEVRGFDPLPDRRVSGVRAARSAADAVDGANVVLSLNSAAVAVSVAQSAVEALSPGRLYADLNTASPATKRALAEIVDLFVDVALLAPVPGRGVRTPALASGRGAPEFAARFRPLGMPVELVGPDPGAAAARKLVRSVFVKGVAAAAVESLAAGSAAGCGEWLRAEIVAVLENADEALLDRLLAGSRTHAARRVDEMEAAAELLRELGVEPRIATATAAALADLAERTAS
jgi:3-hydroxyisobutyrate dehydrogenase-like beta-hydroxyacid dehydrogenase